VIIECTGVPQLVLDAIQHLGSDGVLCLTGVSALGPKIGVQAGAINRELVLENGVVFGSVNANRRHYEAAAEALRRADRRWLQGLITRRVGLDELGHAFERQPEDVKVVIDLS
jgi:threonine dehydrogenase-like Zn-dependent dehydrogenase